MTEPLFLTPPPYLSPSSMGTFHQCPQKFRYNKIDQLPDSPTEATLMGNFVHEVLEYFYAAPETERTLVLLKDLASATWVESNWLEKVVPYVPDPNDLRVFRWNSWWCLENIFKIEDSPLVDVTSIEYELNGEIGGVMLKGFIDRMTVDDNESITISDYKTGKTPKKQWVGDKFLQLKIYGTLAENLGVGTTDTLELLYLKDGVKFDHQFTDKDREETTAYVVDTKRKIDIACETEEFPTKKSILCNWCGYKNICPAWKA